MKKRETQWIAKNGQHIKLTWEAILQGLEPNKDWNADQEDFQLAPGTGALITHLKNVSKKCPTLVVFEHLAYEYGLDSALPKQVFEDIINSFPKPTKKDAK